MSTLITTQDFADISKRTLIGDFMLCSFIGQPQIALICHQSRPLTIGSEKCFHRDPNESLSLILPLLGNQCDPVGTEQAKDLQKT